MSTEPQRTCPSCGSELSGAMEFCPLCLLRKRLADGVESGESSASEEAAGPSSNGWSAGISKARPFAGELSAKFQHALSNKPQRR